MVAFLDSLKIASEKLVNLLPQFSREVVQYTQVSTKARPKNKNVKTIVEFNSVLLYLQAKSYAMT